MGEARACTPRGAVDFSLRRPSRALGNWRTLADGQRGFGNVMAPSLPSLAVREQ